MPRHRRGWAMERGIGSGGRGNHSPLVVSLLEPMLLILLKQQPRHGYTLLSELAKRKMRSMHPSVVYRTLRELEDLGWIQSDWETTATQGPPRRIYRLTDLGDNALKNWREELKDIQDLISSLCDQLEEERS